MHLQTRSSDNSAHVCFWQKDPLLKTASVRIIYTCLSFSFIFHTSSLPSLGSVPCPALQILHWPVFPVPLSDRAFATQWRRHKMRVSPASRMVCRSKSVATCCDYKLFSSLFVQSKMQRLYNVVQTLLHQSNAILPRKKLRQPVGHILASFHITARRQTHEVIIFIHFVYSCSCSVSLVF